MATAMVVTGKKQREKRLGVISTRVTDIEEAAFRAAAQDQGQTASDVLRSLALEFLMSSSYTGAVRMYTAELRMRDQRTREIAAELFEMWRAS